MRLKILVEGDTEQKFVKTMLCPYLQQHWDAIIPVKNRTSTVQSGGVSHYAQFRKNLCSLKERSGCRITTMIDLYHLPSDFPGYENPYTGRERVKQMEQDLRTDLSREIPDLIPYIQLHEFEALLFSDEEIINSVLPGASSKRLREIQDITRRFGEPELINTGKGPSIYLDELCSGHYAKILYGVQIAERIGVDKIREKCPHFHEWLDELENFRK